MAPKVLVIGSTGYVGSSTIQALAKDGVSVLAGVRDPASDKAKPIGEPANVTLVKADMADPASIDAVIKANGDLTSVFVVTPGAENRTELTNQTLDAIYKANSKLFALVVSVPLVEQPETLFGKQCGGIEAHAKKVGLPYANLRLPFFVDNNYANVGSIKEQGKFYGPLPPTTKLTQATLHDIAAAAVTILKSPAGHAGKTYTIASPPFSNAELAEAFSAALGKPVEYVQVPYDAAKSAFMSLGLPEWQAGGVMEIFKSAEAGDNASTGTFDDFTKLTGAQPLDVKGWVEANKGGFQ